MGHLHLGCGVGVCGGGGAVRTQNARHIVMVVLWLTKPVGTGPDRFRPVPNRSKFKI
jgi:hypothetical protein